MSFCFNTFQDSPFGNNFYVPSELLRIQFVSICVSAESSQITRVGYVKFKFPNCSFLATVLWYEPLPLHKLLITTQPGLHRIKRVRVTTGALCRTSKSFKIKQNLSPTISQKREDNTRNVGRSRKGLAGQQENRESKKTNKNQEWGRRLRRCHQGEELRLESHKLSNSGQRSIFNHI